LRGGKHLCATSCALVTLAAGGPAAAATTNARERALLAEMNRVRAMHGLRPLRFDPHLHRAARAHSRDMVRRGYFAHGRLAQRLRRYRFRADGRVLGENLAWGTGALGRPGTIVRMWLRSPPHRRLLLRAGFSHVGIGAVGARFQGAHGATVVTANFAGG
jgi:uncharacterized protein YkwD